MSCHPESLGCAIPLLLQGIGNPEVAMPATMALKDVTRENLDHIQPYIQQILQASKVSGMRQLKQYLTLCMLGNFSCVFCSLSTFCKINFLTKFFQKHYQSVKQFGPR